METQRQTDFASLRSLMGIVFNIRFYSMTHFQQYRYGTAISIGKGSGAADAPKHWNSSRIFRQIRDNDGDKGLRIPAAAPASGNRRALVNNPPILILDEATSSRRYESEQKVSGIDHLMKSALCL
jgi:hypothetical protein